MFVSTCLGSVLAHLSVTLHYGDAYDFDGNKWRYVHNGELVPHAYTIVDARTGDAHLSAPELLVHQMIDVPALADLLGINSKSIPHMLYHKRLPQPQARAGKQGPMWSLPVIEYFISQRRGRDWAKGQKKVV